MGSTSGIKRALLGVEVTLFGGVFGLASATMTSVGPSPLSPVGLAVALVGLLIAIGGMAPDKPA